MAIAAYIGHILSGGKSAKITSRHRSIGEQWFKNFDPTDVMQVSVLLQAACKASKYDYDLAYITHWLKHDGYNIIVPLESILIEILKKLNASRHYHRSQAKYNFIDLFCGVGGFHLALERSGAKCVFASDINELARSTYFHNFHIYPFGDITEAKVHIPPHDILCAGFPCQPFSSAGKRLGFSDTRGTLFFEILSIAESHKPRVLFLENVRNLKDHDAGKTFAVICECLSGLGYALHHRILNSKHFGLPQSRERIYIVAFKDKVDFTFPEPTSVKTNVGSILEDDVDEKYTLSDKLWTGHQRRAALHSTENKGFKYSLCGPHDSYTRTLTARYGKDGKEILIPTDQNPRRLTPRECARLQGFPESFQLVGSDSANYRQFGNSVPVTVVSSIAAKIVEALDQCGNDKP